MTKYLRELCIVIEHVDKELGQRGAVVRPARLPPHVHRAREDGGRGATCTRNITLCHQHQ